MLLQWFSNAHYWYPIQETSILKTSMFSFLLPWMSIKEIDSIVCLPYQEIVTSKNSSIYDYLASKYRLLLDFMFKY